MIRKSTLKGSAGFTWSALVAVGEWKASIIKINYLKKESIHVSMITASKD